MAADQKTGGGIQKNFKKNRLSGDQIAVRVEGLSVFFLALASSAVLASVRSIVAVSAEAYKVRRVQADGHIVNVLRREVYLVMDHISRLATACAEVHVTLKDIAPHLGPLGRFVESLCKLAHGCFNPPIS